MFYDKKIKYLDYYEDGLRVGGCGYVKLEARDGCLRMELAATGLRPTDSFERDVFFLSGGEEKKMGRIQITSGRGAWKMQWGQLEDIGGSGFSYGELEGVSVPLGGGREISCIWQTGKGTVPGQGSTRKKGMPDQKEGVPDREPARGREVPGGESAWGRSLSDGRDAREKVLPGRRDTREEVLPDGEAVGEGKMSGGKGIREKVLPGRIDAREEVLSDGRGTWERSQPGGGGSRERNHPDGRGTWERDQKDGRGARDRGQPDRGAARDGRLPGRQGDRAYTLEAELKASQSESGRQEPGKGAQMAGRTGAPRNNRKHIRLMEDKWAQLWAIYPHIKPFQDEREYLSVSPADFVLFPESSYKMVNNSFLLHGYYNYDHLILARTERKGEICYYICVPGSFFEKEKQEKWGEGGKREIKGNPGKAQRFLYKGQVGRGFQLCSRRVQGS